MGTSLSGLLPQDTYQGLLKFGDNSAISGTLKTLSDGAGNNLPMQASTTGINFTGTTTGLASGVSGAIQFSDGSAFASDASNLFWDDTNNRLGVGTNAPSARVDIKGVGTTSATSSLIVQNSAGTLALQVLDDSRVVLGNSSDFAVYSGSGITARYAMSIGSTSLPTAQLQVKGSGSTSATTSLLVQNSSGTELLRVYDDGYMIGRDVQANSFSVANEGIYTTTSVYGLQLISASYNVRVGSSNLGAAGNASAMFQVDSTTKGFLPPRMTNTQRSAIATPAEGLQIHNTTNNGVAYYDGTNWGYLSGAKQTATGSGGTLAISFAAGNIVDLTLTGSTTLTFAGHVIGTYIIQVTQGGSGSYTLTYPASVKWSGGTAPTLTTTVGKTDILTFYHDGTSFFGTYSLNY